MLAPENLVRNLHVQISIPVLLYVIAAGVVCALLCGVGPAYQMTHIRWFQSLQESGRSETVEQRHASGCAPSMVIGEIALAMLLLVSAGLLVRSLKQAERVEVGFEPQGLMSASLTLPRDTYKTDEQQAAFAQALDTQLKSQAGVTDAALVDALPFSANGGLGLVRDRWPGAAAERSASARQHPSPFRPITFATLKIPLVEGRFFTSTDQAKTQQVAIVDETLARDYWPGQDPVGQQIKLRSKTSRHHHRRAGEARARVVAGAGQQRGHLLPSALAIAVAVSLDIVVRTSANPEQHGRCHPQCGAPGGFQSGGLRSARPWSERIDTSLVSRRFIVVLLSMFAGLALLLSAIGLYGVISYGVHMRVRELGIRMALGAGRSDVLALVLRRGMEMAAAGLVIGASRDLPRRAGALQHVVRDQSVPSA